ncbi:hypothetical protein Lepil_1511 [Leptonema illini DSM 21528]|uniref:Uncharacterized protein n=1 Tax=Leptonema illini DSM 21528 TaxID=929563 RepID=H2CKW6_9LEPT|nr:hypothetical protein Lepil_1511 [Leptonema illini DSM 21528]
MFTDKFSVRVNRDVQAEVWREIWTKPLRLCSYTKRDMTMAVKRTYGKINTHTYITSFSQLLNG